MPPLFLRPALQRAAVDPGRLGSALGAYSTSDLCERLACDARTAQWLCLAATPRRAGWLSSVRSMARALAVDPVALSLLLSEALARPSGGAGGRGAVAAASAHPGSRIAAPRAR